MSMELILKALLTKQYLDFLLVHRLNYIPEANIFKKKLGIVIF
jgi:hypothetical protein